jgi:hypothetical protein
VARDMREELSRLLYEDDAMEMVEWSILGIVFALACVFRPGVCRLLA